MNKVFLVVLIFFIQYVACYSQKYTISGYVEEASSGEKLLGVNIYDASTLKGTITNNYGFYSLTLPRGKVKLTFSYVSYQPQIMEISLHKDTVINFAFSETVQLEGVEIIGERVDLVESSQISIAEVPVKTIQSMPILLGEADILKAVQLMPGVQSGTEGTSGIYVRGGGPDQNLILLDGVPVYNVNHLFGFFSVFNPDAINDITLIKGGFPARYGGRLSSVLDIRMKEGNNKEFKGEGSIGLISSKLTLEGPVINKKTSFIVTGRRTYIDALLQPLLLYIRNAEDFDKYKMGYYFYDLNAKINHTFSDKSRLYLSSYMGNDKAYVRTKYSWDNDEYYEEDFMLRWGNITTALRWNYIISNKLFSNTTLTYSRYKFIVGADFFEAREENQTDLSFEYSSGIEDLAAKIDFDYFPSPNQKIKFGVSDIYHTFRPGVNVFYFSNSNDSIPVDTSFGNRNVYAHEYALYIEDDIKISNKIKMNIGIHHSGFYVNDEFYYSLQPRISGRYLINEKWSVKAAYSEMTQYIHLLSNSNIGLPTDLWVPVTNKIKPQRAIQYAIASVYKIKNYDISVEGFYKTMDNLIEYKEGASFFSTDNDWEDKLELGEGKSYGVELFAQKRAGKTTGWVGYTLSWSTRQFENISFGKEFPYKYDRRHDFSIVITHKIKENVDLGVTWIFGTGNAVTLAMEKYSNLKEYPYDGQPNFFEQFGYENHLEYYEKRNNYRMPAYHRLDVGMNFHKKTKWGDRTVSLGLYNAYNRKNPFFIYYSYDYDNDSFESEDKVLKQISLFPIIPSIKISLKF